MQCCVKFVRQNTAAVIPVKEIVAEFSNARLDTITLSSYEICDKSEDHYLREYLW